MWRGMTWAQWGRQGWMLAVCLILFLLPVSHAETPYFSVSPPFLTVGPEASPFRGDQETKKKLAEQEVLASVKVVVADNKVGSVKQLEMNVIEWVPVYADQAFEQIKSFEFLSEMKPYIVEQRWNVKSKTLFIHGQAFEYHARMWMEFYYLKMDGAKGKKHRYQIHWRHTKGLFSGMSGVVVVEDVGRRMSQISMTTRYNFVKLPLPNLFVEFGLEVILKKMAFHVKKHILRKISAK